MVLIFTFQTSQKNGHGEVGFFLMDFFILSHILVSCFCLMKLVSTFNSCSLFRKIEIVQFASRTRQLFVRLLALVKWASNAGKVEK